MAPINIRCMLVLFAAIAIAGGNFKCHAAFPTRRHLLQQLGGNLLVNCTLNSAGDLLCNGTATSPISVGSCNATEGLSGACQGTYVTPVANVTGICAGGINGTATGECNATVVVPGVINGTGGCGGGILGPNNSVSCNITVFNITTGRLG